MGGPKVSIVIPSYNRAEHVLNAVDAARSQTYSNTEVIVVVDGSKDGTVEKLENYRAALPEAEQNQLVVIYQDNQGASAARNTGVQHSSGDYIAFLDDDDVWHPEKIAKQIALVSQHPVDGLLLCTTDHYEIKHGQTEAVAVENSGSMTFEGQLANNRFSPTITWLMPRTTFDALDGFDTSIHAGEDADFVIKLRKANAICINVAEPLATYNMPPEGKIYRDQDLSAARSLAKHGDWFMERMPAEKLNNVFAFYRTYVPEELREEAAKNLKAAGIRDMLGLKKG